MWDRNDPVKHSLKELGSELSHRRATEGMAKERVRRPLRRETKMAVGMAIVLALAMVVAAINLFTHTFPAGGSGPVTPTFSLGGTLYTGLAIVASAAIGTSCTGGTALTSGTGLTPPAGNYDYCASYTGAGVLPGFTLTWSQ